MKKTIFGCLVFLLVTCATDAVFSNECAAPIFTALNSNADDTFVLSYKGEVSESLFEISGNNFDNQMKVVLRGQEDGKVYAVSENIGNSTTVIMAIVVPSEPVSTKLDLEVTKDGCSGSLLYVPHVAEFIVEDPNCPLVEAAMIYKSIQKDKITITGNTVEPDEIYIYLDYSAPWMSFYLRGQDDNKIYAACLPDTSCFGGQWVKLKTVLPEQPVSTALNFEVVKEGCEKPLLMQKKGVAEVVVKEIMSPTITSIKPGAIFANSSEEVTVTIKDAEAIEDFDDVVVEAEDTNCLGVSLLKTNLPQVIMKIEAKPNCGYVGRKFMIKFQKNTLEGTIAVVPVLKKEIPPLIQPGNMKRPRPRIPKS